VEVVSVSQSERLELNYSGITSATDSLLTGPTISTREEPHLTQAELERTSLAIYDAGGMYEYWVLENPSETLEWIRAHKDDYVDVEDQR
jgi:hypothetical protein